MRDEIEGSGTLGELKVVFAWRNVDREKRPFINDACLVGFICGQYGGGDDRNEGACDGRREHSAVNPLFELLCRERLLFRFFFVVVCGVGHRRTLDHFFMENSRKQIVNVAASPRKEWLPGLDSN